MLKSEGIFFVEKIRSESICYKNYKVESENSKCHAGNFLIDSFVQSSIFSFVGKLVNQSMFFDAKRHLASHLLKKWRLGYYCIKNLNWQTFEIILIVLCFSLVWLGWHDKKHLSLLLRIRKGYNQILIEAK